MVESKADTDAQKQNISKNMQDAYNKAKTALENAKKGVVVTISKEEID